MTLTTDRLPCAGCGGETTVAALCRHRHPVCLSCCQLDHFTEEAA